MDRRLAPLVLFPTLLLTLAAAGAAPKASSTEWSSLYHQVAGGEEQCQVSRGENLTTLALRKGVKWQWLAARNDIKKPFRLKPGMVLKINTTHIVPAEIDNGLVINLPELMLYYFRDGVYQRRYSLAVGKRTWPTPTGDYAIQNKTRNPTWVVPPSIQEEMAEQGREVIEKVPPGPKNPLGAYWMGTSAPGVGLHATNIPWSVGHFVSHGCVRMLPDDIAELYPQVAIGTPVKIIYRPIKMALTPQGRIYLEVHPNIYRHELDPKSWVEEVARLHRLQDRIDWDRVPTILKAKDGIAYDVTRGAEAPGTRTAQSQGTPQKKPGSE
jgi:L,D-transpeptidase ErfK/SrfK